MYKFEILRTRRDATSTESNDAIFASGPVVGVEMTGCRERTAIQDALEAPLPPEGATIATVRADLNAVGSMAILAMRARGENLKPARYRIARVVESDRWQNKGRWSPRPLPTWANPWPEESDLAAIAASAMDFRVSMADRVARMEQWLLTGEEPAGYRSRVEAERAALVSALELGEIGWCVLHTDGIVAAVEASHRAAISVGYALAPVVVAANPAFWLDGSDPYLKFTICQYAAGIVDLGKVLAELNELEPGWGGSPTIGESPQGVSSTLTTWQVVEVVGRHFL